LLEGTVNWVEVPIDGDKAIDGDSMEDSDSGKLKDNDEDYASEEDSKANIKFIDINKAPEPNISATSSSDSDVPIQQKAPLEKPAKPLLRTPKSGNYFKVL
jgi:hypothetical protein